MHPWVATDTLDDKTVALQFGPITTAILAAIFKIIHDLKIPDRSP